MAIKPKRERVPLDRLIRDASLQMRSALPDGLTDAATVERYQESIAEGEEFPPLEVMSDGQSYWLFDGFQRAAAFERAGKGSVECLVFNGAYPDALLRAIAANARHGLTRTANDCRRAMNTLLDTPELLQKVLDQAATSGGVHRALAAACGISKSLVYKILDERNLRVLAGKLVKRRVVPTGASNRPAQAATCEITDPSQNESRETDALPHIEVTDLENTHSISQPDSLPLTELERARAAIVHIGIVCRKLLDGPLAAQFLRCAANHHVPFRRHGDSQATLTSTSPQEILSTIAWWEPLQALEAVLADLAACANAGIDPPE
jgi:uncharacterized ParB-like nuclease family protein